MGKYIGLTFVLLVVIISIALALLYRAILTPPLDDPEITLLARQDTSPTGGITQWLSETIEHRDSPFSLAAFAAPSRALGPWTRWWWPGNLVDMDQLAKEMAAVAEQGLAGVEIQPFAISLSAADLAQRAWLTNGWDAPDFYRHVRAVMELALVNELQVDRNNGSGWPTGGHHVAMRDGLLQLLHSETLVTGPRELALRLPPPTMPLTTLLAGAVGILSDTPMQTFALGKRGLVAVVAGKITANERRWQPWDLRDQVALAPGSLVDISTFADGDTLHWQVPEGNWAIIALWQLPGGELIAGGHAHPRPGYVVDHLDAERMVANQNYFFREDTGLAPYYDKPLRAIFNDSLEFRQERHWAREHLPAFRLSKGYDLLSWLPALIEPGADQMPFHALNIGTLPVYDLGEWGQLWPFAGAHRWRHTRSTAGAGQLGTGRCTRASGYGCAHAFVP
ncbi:MAG: hypothetical protein HRT77_15855 [Halioglobus sp.]|nr:hypothetical protein [Halioglobus sp.]